ncbi:MAG: DUF928 domain-containing protein [Cyanobacteria bacterium P01_F01_bin.150]
MSILAYLGGDALAASPVTGDVSHARHLHAADGSALSAAMALNRVSENTPSAPSSNQQPSPWGDPYTGNGTSTDARGSCLGVDVPLVALIPDINHGRSLASQPTLWFYVPYSSETISRGIFLLQNRDHDNVIAPLEFTLPGTPGFVSLTLPPSAQSLKANEAYRWYFELYCADNNESPIYVNGWIEKTVLENSSFHAEDGLSDQAHYSDTQLTCSEILNPGTLSNPQPEYLYSWYRQNFIWFDAVDTILQQWTETPDDYLLTEELQALLQSANVEFNTLPENFSSTAIQYD